MSAGNKEKAPDGGLENSDETEDPSGNSKEGKPELEVEDENEGRDEKSKDVTESPGAMSLEKENCSELDGNRIKGRLHQAGQSGHLKEQRP